MTTTPIIGWLLVGLEAWDRMCPADWGDGAAACVRGLSGWLNMLDRYHQEHGPLTESQVHDLVAALEGAADRLTRPGWADQPESKAALDRVLKVHAAYTGQPL